MLAALVIIVALVPLLSFSWGLRGHFRSVGGMPPGMRALTAASSVAALLFFVLILRKEIEALPALVFLLLSTVATLLFWWAVRTTREKPPMVAHSSDDPDTLHAEGPYAYVRHPFYLAYCLFWLGTAILAGGVQWLVVILLAGWYFTTARAEEVRFLNSGMAPSYLEYRNRTGMIVPRVRRARRC